MHVQTFDLSTRVADTQGFSLYVHVGFCRSEVVRKLSLWISS